jgi:hypothetical protein
MKYKFIYEDSNHVKHKRYYHALNVNTATEMFRASIDHSFGDKEITLLEIYRLDPEGTGWQSKGLHVSDISYTPSLR